MLLINLLAAHLRYYQPGKRKIGIALIHLGVVLLLVGQMLTDVLSRESALHLRIGETKNYSEADRAYELAVIDTTEKDSDKVVAIPCSVLVRRGAVSDPEMPFTVRAKTFYANSELTETNAAGFEPVKTTAGVGAGFWWRELPRVTAMDRVDQPSAIVEIATPQGSLGTFLVSAMLAQPQQFTYQQPHLRNAVAAGAVLHAVQPAPCWNFTTTNIPARTSPRIFPAASGCKIWTTGENREVLIYMNNPLRYQGETFYQASYDPDDGGSILQVVHNPSWLTPYFSCVMVAHGFDVAIPVAPDSLFETENGRFPGATGVPPASGAAHGKPLAGGTPRASWKGEKEIMKKWIPLILVAALAGWAVVRHSPAAGDRFSNPRIRQTARADGRPLPAV